MKEKNIILVAQSCDNTAVTLHQYCRFCSESAANSVMYGQYFLYLPNVKKKRGKMNNQEFQLKRKNFTSMMRTFNIKFRSNIYCQILMISGYLAG